MPVDLDESQFLAQSIALPLVRFKVDRSSKDKRIIEPVELLLNRLYLPLDVLELYARVLIDDNMTKEARGKLLDYMNRDKKNEIAEKFQFNNDWINSKVRGLIHLILTMPEAQMA